MKYLISKILLISIFLIIDCGSFYQTKHLVYSTRSSAFYRIPKDEIKGKEFIQGKFIHPFPIQPEKLTDILGNLRFKKHTQIGSLNDYVFHLNELSTLTADLSQVLENLKPEDCVMGISMFDHIESVISNNKRTTFLLWVDAKGLNLVLGEIQSDVARDTAKNFLEWTQVPQISLNIVPDANEIDSEKGQLYTFNKVNGYTNKKWLIFPLTDLNIYQLKDRKIPSVAPNASSGKKSE
ncbi:MAG TPA: hypothetical protein PK079_02360 [Leptospiraceae bacterium]|nr:hypothetical protein [Leptospiraceae bacterium]HMW04047.1 hypothetical protein [Leptospiraceae bacterium]HMX30937.1 hypothetical protein [Leptospiraceae bacterium]HMY30041.1 hypothetical protein [Leptospiraceae bacterium]HMZ62772.1 hypothetical protein [Leptospiraceae bacterium]